ncbi:hypothetical protein RJ639_008267 [Escallonia herrerae]|uniref:Uncharacterized protein n=1 Tax=Escallonia herrerae TaxID=1293975 RepID=A0AA89ASA2_9ASTE|nr:hypothetical protein RJ639_008267 [Escallonia herrerae]
MFHEVFTTDGNFLTHALLDSGAEGYPVDSSDVDSIITSIRDHDITPEKLKLFLPKVNWENLVSMYVSGRSGAECEARQAHRVYLDTIGASGAVIIFWDKRVDVLHGVFSLGFTITGRWRNCEDPLINRHPWTKMEDKFLLQIVQKRGISNWIEIAVSLGTNRTPFQCLARYQRSLNASILKSEWTEDDDDKLRTAVAAFGESDWQRVASTMEGRTVMGLRWLKTLHPTRQRVGTWTPDEDKRLKVAVMLFGAKNWRKIAIYVPGRTHVQCRERWVNCLDPALNLGKWSKEEDSRLKEAILELGYCWSKVAACVPPRTDSQCRRRWKYLCPHEVPLLQAARKVQKAALIANFVDRESERPALGPKDFLPLPMIDSIPESRKVVASEKQTRKLSFVKKTRSKRPTREGPICAQKILRLMNGTDDENFSSGDDITRTKQVKNARLKNRKSTSSSSPLPGTTLLDITNGEDAGACDEDAHRSNRKASGRRKRKSRDNNETKDTDKGVGYNAILKGRTSKSVSVESEASETVSTEVGAFGDDDVTKNGRASNLRKKRSSKEVEVNTSFKELKAFYGDDSISSFLTKRMEARMEAKLCAKNKNTDPTEDQLVEAFDQTNSINTQEASKPPAPCTTLVRRTSGEGVVASGGDKNASSEERAPRCSTPDISDNPNSRAFVICRRNRPQRTRTDDTGEGTLRNQLLEIEDGDDLTLASFIKQSGEYQISTSFPAMVSKPCPKRRGRRNIVKGSKRIPLSRMC